MKMGYRVALQVVLAAVLFAGGSITGYFVQKSEQAATTDAWAQLPLYVDECKMIAYEEFPPMVYSADMEEVEFGRNLITPLIHVAVPFGAPCSIARSWSSGRYHWCDKPRLPDTTASWCHTEHEGLEAEPFWVKGSFYLSPSGLLAAESAQKYGAARAVMEAFADYLVMIFRGENVPSTASMRACYVGAFAEGLHKHSLIQQQVVAALRAHYPANPALFDRGAANPRSCRLA